MHVRQAEDVGQKLHQLLVYHVGPAVLRSPCKVACIKGYG